MKYAELHAFADPRFVMDGFTHFLWATQKDQPFAPIFPYAFGFALIFEDGDAFPDLYSRYNPTIQAWGSPLTPTNISATSEASGLSDYFSALWDHESGRWVIEDVPYSGQN